MRGEHWSDVWSNAKSRRLAVLEGKWLGHGGGDALVTTDPVSVLEGAEDALREFPGWLAWHAQQHPEGAAIGYLAYELARFFEHLPLVKCKSLPDVCFAYYPRVERWPRSNLTSVAEPSGPLPEVQTNFDEESYAKAVATIRRYIAAGDIYQANLTQQFVVRLGGLSPAEVYRRLSAGQASFRAYRASPERTIISNSPERFFRVSGRHILASPVKGTIARGADRDDDNNKIAQLLSSQKDLAENVMIVDLLRNDLGRICEYGSVRARLYEVDPLPHLFHLVSHVSGTLRAEVGLLEILRALFPCGSITGAPKIRAMEILSGIEKVPRGVSMGAIGVIIGRPGMPGFEMDFNVAIRTMTVEDGAAVFNVGGGVVYDSQASSEHQEMMLKARPLLEALGVPVTREPSEASVYASEL